MGKGARARSNRAEEIAQKKEITERLEKKKKIRKTVWQIVGMILLIAAIAALIVGLVRSQRKKSGVDLRTKTAVSTQNFTVNNAMMSFFLHDRYNSMVDQYGNFLQNFGLDQEVPLYGQWISDSETWFDFIAESVQTDLEKMLPLCELAREKGIELTQAEKEAIKIQAEAVNLERHQVGVKSTDIEDALAIRALAAKCEKAINAEKGLTDADIDKEYKDNTKNYDEVDYLRYVFSYEAEDEEKEEDTASDDAEETVKLTREEAQQYANELAAVKTESEWDAWMRDYLKKTKTDLTDEDLEAQVNATHFTAQKFTETDDFSNWAFNSSTKVGDVDVSEMNDSFFVGMLTVAPHRDERETVDIRDILFMDRDYDGSSHLAQKKAQDILQEWTDAGKTDESFTNLAIAYSADPDSKYKGGNLSVRPGEKSTDYNDWCFDESRQPGDTEVIQLDAGSIILNFIGKGDAMWKSDVRKALLDADLEEKLTAAQEKYKVKVDDIMVHSVAF